jgi:hypothetical protein
MIQISVLRCLMSIAKIILCVFIVLLMTCIIPVTADSVKSVVNSDNGNKPTILTEYGTGKDTGLIKVTHIHYAKSSDKGKPAKTATCYKLAGWKWSSPITYTVNTENSGLDNVIDSAKKEWDEHSSATLFNDNKPGILPWGIRDNKNSVTFGNYPTEGVIAVTSTWYSPATKRAVESDILFDTDFAWGNGETNPEVMDLQNIATHEIGHTLGLSDLYTSSCNAVTMYGYSGEGDIGKRTLELPDQTGLKMLYGI